MSLIQSALIVSCCLPAVATFLLGYQLLRNGQGIFGRPTIAPLLFYPVKLIIVVVMTSLPAAAFFPDFFLYFPWLIQTEIPDVQKLMAVIFLTGGNLLLIPAYYSMSIFTRVGLPVSPHALQTKGVFRISRNPMYASFIFFQAACFLLIPSLLLLALMTCNQLVHHVIILKEEKFLEDQFHEEYLLYKKDTARYL
ncbi:methyltransferase family protein [Gaoshiqia sp. Z1-71]|uniref:methyltransferase family protein n=1 Tax=Gaoshiqia hydrogeniformans TaxID=3290090 RepID=UPI003BF83AC4